MRTSIVSATASALLIVSGPTAAQTIDQFQQKVKPLRASLSGDEYKAFFSGLDALRQQEEHERSLQGSITFGFNGDESAHQSLFKFNTGATLKGGVPPGQLSFDTKLTLQLKDGQLQEDVATFRFNYDYQLSTSVQYYAFAERFSDNFLSIQERYEVGFGMRVGQPFGLTTAGVGDVASARDVRKGMTAIEQRLAGPTMTKKDFTDLTKAVRQIENFSRVSEARVYVGLAVSVFAELERAQIEATVVSANNTGGGADTSGETTKKFALDATQRYRLTLRPTLVLQPATGLRVMIYPYFKLPLGPPRYVLVAANDRRLDYRRDILTEADWKLKGGAPGQSVEFTFQVDHYFDNVPPTLPMTIIDAERAAGRTLANTAASRTHRAISLGLKVNWGG